MLVVWLSFSASKDQRKTLDFSKFRSVIEYIGNVVWHSSCIAWQPSCIERQSNRIELHRITVRKAPVPNATRTKCTKTQGAIPKCANANTPGQRHQCPLHQRPSAPQAQGTIPGHEVAASPLLGCPCYESRRLRDKPVQRGERYQHSKLVIISSYDSTFSRHTTQHRHANIGCSTPTSAHLGRNLKILTLLIYIYVDG